jgi:hypothetical protein
MTGIPVTYSGALIRLVEVAKLANDTALASLYAARLALNRKGLHNYLAPAGDYFVRSVDPNGTMHGVLGQTRSVRGGHSAHIDCHVRTFRGWCCGSNSTGSSPV